MRGYFLLILFTAEAKWFFFSFNIYLFGFCNSLIDKNLIDENRVAIILHHNCKRGMLCTSENQSMVAKGMSDTCIVGYVYGTTNICGHI